MIAREPPVGRWALGALPGMAMRKFIFFLRRPPSPLTYLVQPPFSPPILSLFSPILFFRPDSFPSLPLLHFVSGPSSTPLGDARRHGQTRAQETQAGSRLPILVHSDCLPSFHNGSFASRGAGMEII